MRILTHQGPDRVCGHDIFNTLAVRWTQTSADLTVSILVPVPSCKGIRGHVTVDAAVSLLPCVYGYGTLHGDRSPSNHMEFNVPFPKALTHLDELLHTIRTHTPLPSPLVSSASFALRIYQDLRGKGYEGLRELLQDILDHMETTCES